MRFLLYFRIAANFGADWAEDLCSLERIGFLPKGTLGNEFMLFAEFCQLALATVEVGVTGVRARKEAEVTAMAEAGGASDEKLVKQQRKLALVRLELVKFVSDLGKVSARRAAPPRPRRARTRLTPAPLLCACLTPSPPVAAQAFFDCELSFSHEGIFICCSFFSAIVSTHKNMVKVLK